MNKILFLILSLILVACASPQTSEVLETSEVSTTPPPTQTSIPTPTLHPEFIALQKLIADSSQRLILLPDGSIEDNGTLIPNLHVGQNGIINIIFNNEHVAIEQSQIVFDDETGLSIEGYELENDEWVEAVNEAMQIFHADFGKYNVSIDQYNVVEKDGNLLVTNLETGEIVYQNGSFEPLFLGQLIVENNMCKQTEWTGSKVGPVFPKDLGSYLKDYADPITRAYLLFIDNKVIQGTGTMLQPYYMGDGCWGQVQFSKEGQINAWYLWKNGAGKVLYQHVFLPPKE